MFFPNDRQQLRQMYIDAWQKHQSQQVLTPLEQQISHVILLHPEYHALFEYPEAECDKDYLPEQGKTNPFLHMGLHLGLMEQVSTNRPAGIKDLYHALLAKHQDNHEVEHQMIECLAEAMWHAQRNNTPPDDRAYLENLKRLL